LILNAGVLQVVRAKSTVGKAARIFWFSIYARGMNEAEKARRFWRRRALTVVLRRNLAGWLEVFLPALLGCTVAFAGALLILRKSETNTRVAWIIYGTGLIFLALGSLWRAWPRFFSLCDALVRLEVSLHLHNRLTAAACGVGAWPEPTEDSRDGFRWRMTKILVPIFASVLLVWAAISVPLVLAITDQRPPNEQPLAWSQVESWRETLEKENLVEQPALEKLKNQLDELRQQAPEKWYSHSSLEAGDNLRQETEQSLRELQRDLQIASEALAALQKFGEQVSVGDLKNIDEALKKALAGLQLGNLPLNKELLERLKNFDPNKLKQLSPEQLAELIKRLKEGTGVCQNCLGAGDKKDGDQLLIVGEQTGSGGPGGGGGPAPLTLKKEPTQLASGKTEAITGDDLTRTTPGEVLGISKGEHEVEKTANNGPVEAGAIRSEGEGGETVWKDELTPQERETLQRFFK
jgi:hypothetical protein